MDAGIWREMIEGAVGNPARSAFIRSLAAHADFALMLVDRRGYCIYANQAMCNMTGFSAKELSSQPVHDLLLHHHPDDSPFPKEECPLHQAFINGVSFTQEEDQLFRRKDGSTLLTHCIINPVVIQGETICTAMEICDFGSLSKNALQQMGIELTHQFAMDIAKIGTWERDLASGMVTQSARTSWILGLGEEPTIVSAAEIERLILPEDLAAFNSAVHAAFDAKEPFDLEFRIRRSDGQIRWLVARGMGVRNTDGKPAQVVGVMFDITERKQTEESLRASELSYRLATEAASIGAWELEFATNVATISPTAAQILGLPAEKSTLSEQEWKEMIAPEDRAWVTGIQKTASETGEPFVIEFRMCRPDKKRIWISSRGIVKKDASGHPLKSAGVIIDITEKWETEEALQQSKQRLSLILESSGEGICGIEVDHSCTFINGAGAAMLGYKPEELTGMPIHRAFYAKNDLNALTEKERKLYDAISQGAVLRTEEDFFWRKDGIAIPVLYSISPMVRNGTPAGAVVVFTDISDRKRAEERERQAAMQALSAAETNAKFRTFFEQGSYFAGLVALDGTLIEINKLSLEQCGFTREEVIGKKFWEGAWWNRSAEIMERVQRSVLAAAKGENSRQEITYFWADGSEHVSEMTLAPVSDEDGKLLYIAATGTEITDKIRYAQALRGSEERFRSLSESSPDAMLVEIDGVFAYANMAAVQLIGAATTEELIGRRSFDFIDAEFREVVRAHRALNK
ncbi:MAG: PAS domain S-box protein, partial [Burkholderiaceae bacterium]